LSFANLKLDEKLLRAIEACHYKTPTAIQREAIPVALAGRDLMASAQTGTGKTAAFVLPALQKLLTPSAVKGRGPRVLVLTPTRELAMQVSDNIKQFGSHCKVTSGSIVGGMSYGPQLNLLGRPLDLLVATPGRLMDHMERGRVDFSRLEILILDEADRMLDMGFVDAVRDIAKATPANRQTLLFSATLEGKVLEIARQLLKNPARIQLADNKEQHASITQQVHQADDHAHKHAMLSHLLKNDALYQAVIFTATKRGADKLAETLTAKGHSSAALHGDMNQGQRKRTIDRMRRGEHRLLVATDVAARGLDIAGISHVINFDLPMVPEDYIHRIGRTGRAGATGIAISFVGPEDRHKIAGIERIIGRRLQRETIPGLEPKRAMAGAGAGRGRPTDSRPQARKPSYPPRGGAGRQDFGKGAAHKPRAASGFRDSRPDGRPTGGDKPASPAGKRGRNARLATALG
jgi:superfamily II DNA/RNA helicase